MQLARWDSLREKLRNLPPPQPPPTTQGTGNQKSWAHRILSTRKYPIIFQVQQLKWKLVDQLPETETKVWGSPGVLKPDQEIALSVSCWVLLWILVFNHWEGHVFVVKVLWIMNKITRWTSLSKQIFGIVKFFIVDFLIVKLSNFNYLSNITGVSDSAARKFSKLHPT